MTDNNKIMTAEEFMDQELYDGVEPSGYFHGEALDFFESKMIEFAKYHVKLALEFADNNAQVEIIDIDEITNNPIYGVESDSILNAYNLDNIK